VHGSGDGSRGAAGDDGGGDAPGNNGSSIAATSKGRCQHITWPGTTCTTALQARWAKSSSCCWVFCVRYSARVSCSGSALAGSFGVGDTAFPVGFLWCHTLWQRHFAQGGICASLVWPTPLTAQSPTHHVCTCRLLACSNPGRHAGSASRSSWAATAGVSSGAASKSVAVCGSQTCPYSCC
jgi:hypothetical protein